MSLDLSPGGQYATYDWLDISELSEPQNYDCALSIFRRDQSTQFHALYKPHCHAVTESLTIDVDLAERGGIVNVYNKPLDWDSLSGKIIGTSYYKNLDGSPAMIPIASLEDGSYLNFGDIEDNMAYKQEINQIRSINPMFITDRQTFINVWQTHWAYQLLPYHPEFCYLRSMIENKSFFKDLKKMENKLNKVLTFQHAIDASLLALKDGVYILNLPQSLNFLENKLLNYRNDTSAYQLIYSAVICSNLYVTIDGQKLCFSSSPKKGLIRHDYDEANDKMWALLKGLFLGVVNDTIKNLQINYLIKHDCPQNTCIGSEIHKLFESTGFFEYVDNWIQEIDAIVPNSNQYCHEVAFSNKTKRFLQNNDLVGLDPLNEKLSDFLLAKMKIECGKCPLVSGLEALLNGLSYNIGPENVKPLFNMPQTIRNEFNIQNECNGDAIGFNYSIQTQNDKLKILIEFCAKTICSIELNGEKIPWSKIKSFSCLEYLPSASSNTFVIATDLENKRYVFKRHFLFRFEKLS
ncbi:MAG: hypothetical protein IPL98_13085 [Saprospiraceae bacterium]|nr:hypothetical protein [Saprospiraceae bacterium]